MSETRTGFFAFLEPVTGKRTSFLVWLGVLFVSFAWLRAVYVFTPPFGAWKWFGAGLLLLVVGCRGGEPGPRKLAGWEKLALALSGVVGVAFLPWPYDLGPGLLVVCAVLGFLPGPVRRLVLPGLWVGAVILVLQAALLPVLSVLSSRLHEVPLFTPFVYYPLKLVAPETMRTGATIQMATTVDALPLTPSWEKLGFIPGALSAVGFLTVVLLHPRGTSRIPALLVLGTFFAWGRLVLLFLVANRFRDGRVFWDPNLLFWSFLPVPALLAAWWGFGSHRVQQAIAPTGLSRALLGGVAVGAFLCVAGTTFWWGFQDPGTRKSGRVLIDEGHSDWEWTTHAFDKDWYGGRSGYNYYCLADYWSYFYHVETRSDPLTPEYLDDWDVLVLKTPTSPFAPEEIEAIEDFVRQGGGLYLIGDHTNVFGSSTFLNPIAGRFGMYFRYDATYALHNLRLSYYERPSLLPHAVVRNMPGFLFATSCSLDLPLLSDHVMLGYGLRAMYLDYHETSYFPLKEDRLDYLFPFIAQAGAVRFGKGRVLAFTDSTVFSNFFMFIPGKPELALGSIEWLNRANRYGFSRTLALIAGLVGVALLLLAFWRWPRTSSYNMLVPVGILSFVVVASACKRSASSAYPLPEPARELQEIVFDGEHGAFLLPVSTLVSGHWSNMHTFYVWTQRLGLVPRLAPTLGDALRNPGRALVEVNPRHEYTITEVDSITDYVRRGGTLVVLDTPENTVSVSNQILGPFQMSFTGASTDTVAILRPASPAGDWLGGIVPGDTLGVVPAAFGLEGARPLLVLPDGTAVMGSRPFGKGQVIAFGASSLFSTVFMGTTSMVPNARTRALYQAEYDLFEQIAGIRVDKRYASPDTLVLPERE